MHRHSMFGLCVRTGTSSAQAVSFVSKFIQNKSGHMNMAIKHIRDLLEFLKDF